MRKANRKKTIISIAFVILIFTICAFYSRPMTLSQIYPQVALDKCTEIRGYYEIGTQAEPTRFIISSESKEFNELYSLLYERSYRRSLRDILPRGTRIHRTEPDDYQWEVYFFFEEDIEMSDGSISSGAMLQFHNWYGELDIYFNGDRHFYNTSEQEIWGKEILDIIQSTGTERGSST